MCLAMIEIFKGAGILVYPLAVCSIAAVFIICERAYSLRRSAVMPNDLVDAVVAGRPLMGGKHTVLARIVEFAEINSNDEGAVKAFARLEVNRMQRGVPYLDVIYAAAPLIGLSGTVSGLLQVFSQINGDTGLPDPVVFTKGVALALSATIMGLSIAIPSLVGAGYLSRKIENYAAELEVLLERIIRRARVDAALAK
jgi:biopolymer transport protein ExbB